eukprot:scaffold7330_cov277-Pinguiococcus_pyrenoidosus.AAC.1
MRSVSLELKTAGPPEPISISVDGQPGSAENPLARLDAPTGLADGWKERLQLQSTLQVVAHLTHEAIPTALPSNCHEVVRRGMTQHKLLADHAGIRRIAPRKTRDVKKGNALPVCNHWRVCVQPRFHAR